MKTALKIAALSGTTLLLAACGGYTDASEDALADNVEMPADEALVGTPEPVADDAAMEDVTEVAAEEAAVAEAAAEEPAAEEAAAE